MKLKQIVKKVISYCRNLGRRKLVMLSGAVLVLIIGSALLYQNLQAVAALHGAQQLDKAGAYSKAQTKLHSSGSLGVLPNITREIRSEQTHLTQELANQAKIEEVQQLLREHKTAQALKLLQSVTASTAAGANTQQSQQLATLQHTAQQQKNSGASGASGSSSSGSGTSGSGSGSSGSSGGSGGSSGGSGGSPPPPAAMSTITVNSFSASSSPGTATTCRLNESVNFSVNGSGSVHVTWEELSSKSSSSIENPVTYSFAAAGSQSDTAGGSGFPGLQAGDSYRVSVIITDTANGAVTTTAGPTIISTCASPPSLMSPNQASFMSSPVVPGALTAIQSQDPLFSNECQINLQAAFSVSGPGSVQAVYTITSSSSIGSTLYAPQQWSFTGPGSATDSSYTRLPHLPAGDHYTITVKLNVLGDPAHSASTGPITSGCD